MSQINKYVYIHAKGTNLFSYYKGNEFFAQKRLIEQLYPISIENYDFTESNEFYLLMVGHFDVKTNVLQNLCKAVCTFLIQTKDVKEMYCAVIKTPNSLGLYDFDHKKCTKLK